MPAPLPPMLLGPAAGALASVGLGGIGIPGLALALSLGTAVSLATFVLGSTASAGQPAAVDPLTGTGALAGPGQLSGSLSEGFAANTMSGVLAGAGLLGAGIPGLGRAYAKVLSQACGFVVGNVMVAPGAAVEGFTTSAPSPLMGIPASPGQLSPLCLNALHAEEVRGAFADELAEALGQFLAAALLMTQAGCVVAAGRACTPAATASPGMLL